MRFHFERSISSDLEVSELREQSEWKRVALTD